MFSIMPKIPEISVGSQMKRFVLVSSDQKIRDLLWRWSMTLTGGWTKICRSILTSQRNGSCYVLLLFQILYTRLREFGKEIKLSGQLCFQFAKSVK